ncbi:hypothetical protein [Streptomyces sp. NPDC001480]|uniref:hypothetical protein n=1 Tax=Streptomyces sp. NPDC001480 TaxID=3364577 RepID=UPI00369E9E36
MAVPLVSARGDTVLDFLEQILPLVSAVLGMAFGLRELSAARRRKLSVRQVRDHAPEGETANEGNSPRAEVGRHIAFNFDLPRDTDVITQRAGEESSPYDLWVYEPFPLVNEDEYEIEEAAEEAAEDAARRAADEDGDRPRAEDAALLAQALRRAWRERMQEAAWGSDAEAAHLPLGASSWPWTRKVWIEAVQARAAAQKAARRAADEGADLPPDETGPLSTDDEQLVAMDTADTINLTLARLLVRLGPPPLGANGGDLAPVSSGDGGSAR